MNWQKLFEIQGGLDKHIQKEKGFQSKNLIEKKILALNTELGELLNELPEEFKYWSNKKNNRKKALVEYVDGLHFILSIGNELGVKLKDLTYRYEKNTVKQFNSLFSKIGDFSEFQTKGNYFQVLKLFMALGEMLGFTVREIEQAYLEKNKTNHERQLNGY